MVMPYTDLKKLIFPILAKLRLHCAIRPNPTINTQTLPHVNIKTSKPHHTTSTGLCVVLQRLDGICLIFQMGPVYYMLCIKFISFISGKAEKCTHYLC